MLKVAGGNIYGQLCSDSNNKSTNNYPVVSPPSDSNLNTSSLLSYTVYCDHSVWITKEGKIRAVGDNSGGRIHGSLPKEKIVRWIEYQIQDKNDKPFNVISAVCGLYYTLYLLAPHERSNEAKLAYVYYNKNGGMPFFLDTADKYPIALYGGYKTSASINKDGSMFVINKEIFDSPKISPQLKFLPNNEKSISIACCDRFIVALSSTGKIYTSYISPNRSEFTKFEEEISLKGIKIVQISGTFDTCLAVSDNCRVFLNQLNKSHFIEISELKNKNIYAAYSGYDHSLFQDKDGIIFSCGNNEFGQLLSKTGPSSDETVLPSDTSIAGGATFCIAGYQLSAVFLINDPPPNCPNRLLLDIRNSIDKDALDPDIIAENNDKYNNYQSKCCLLL